MCLGLSTGQAGLVLDPTRQHQVQGEGTQNRPPTSIGQVDFGFKWWLIGSVGGEVRQILQNVARNYKKSQRYANFR